MKSVFLNFLLPLFLGITFKGLTGLVVFAGAFLYLINQYFLLRDRVRREYQGSWHRFFSKET